MESYDPLVSPDRDAWLALDESEQLGLVQAYVEHHELGFEGEHLHVAAHVLVENQIALGDETPVRSTHERLMSEGLDRHEALHAISWAFVEMVREWGEQPVEGSEEDYFARMRSLTAEKWRALAAEIEDDEDEPVLVWDPDELVFALERHIYDEDRRANEELGLVLTDASVKSAIRKAMGLSKGWPPKPVSENAKPKQRWVASLAIVIDKMLRDWIREGVPRAEAFATLGAIEGSLKTRRKMTGGERAYLDFLKRFLEDGEVI